jgi:hypothetical protein
MCIYVVNCFTFILFHKHLKLSIIVGLFIALYLAIKDRLFIYKPEKGEPRKVIGGTYNFIGAPEISCPFKQKINIFKVGFFSHKMKI